MSDDPRHDPEATAGPGEDALDARGPEDRLARLERSVRRLRAALAAAVVAAGGALALLDGNGRVRIQQLTAADGTAATLHLDGQGRKRIETVATGGGSAVNSYLDPSGSVRLQIGTGAGGEAVLPAVGRSEEAAEPEPEIAEAPYAAPVPEAAPVAKASPLPRSRRPAAR